MQDAI